MREINMGMVGVGWIAHRQYEGIKASKYASLVAIEVFVTQV